MIRCLLGRHVPIPVVRILLAGTGGWEERKDRCRRCGREQGYRVTPTGRPVDLSGWARP